MFTAAGFVLAGGQSSRMGQDKALVPLAGRPLIHHALDLLHDAGLDASIVGNRPDLASLTAVIPDEHTGLGPLQGICRALAAGSAELAVVVSVDAPLLPASLLEHMLHHARITAAPVTLASVNGFPQTFPCVLARTALPVLTREIEAGRAGCFSAFRAAAAEAGQSVSVLPVELLAQAGHVQHPAGLSTSRWFLNINTPDDLALAERLCSAADRVI